jgi:mRNA-degrading endonuclease toxin of MazEF toxin-antitoxin module
LKKVIKKNSRGLGEVVSTLILLVVAVLLTTVVAYYATNVTMTRTEVEEVRLTDGHVWVNSSGAVGAFKLQNLGGRDLLIDKFSVRGVDSEWSDIYYYRVPSGTVIGGNLNITSYSSLTGSSVLIEGKDFIQADAEIPLISGGELLVYVKGPDNIQQDDIGTTVSISVTTTNAKYITECNVESATDQ